MDSGSQATVYGGGGRSGGKSRKRRPIAARNTPYDRPTPTPQSENPSWVNALVFPAKFVAGGASKLFSSIWNPKSWGSQSHSHSSSSSESDSDSEGAIEDGYEQDGNFHDSSVELNQNKGSSSGKSEILCLVEQLLMLENFSREECDRLIEIINLRAEGMDAGPNSPNTINRAIMEARKYITENPVGSNLKSDLDNSIYASKYVTSPDSDYLSGGSWSIPQLHSKAIEFMKPKQSFFLEAPKPRNEALDIESTDLRTTHDGLWTKALPSLPTIEEKGFKDDKMGDNVIHIDDDCNMVPEYAEVADLVNASQGSSNTNDPTTTKETDSAAVKRAPTRTRKYNTRRGRPRVK